MIVGWKRIINAQNDLDHAAGPELDFVEDNNAGALRVVTLTIRQGPTDSGLPGC